MDPNYAVAIHGGAGALKPGTYTDEEIQNYISFLHTTIGFARSELAQGAPAIDTVSHLCQKLEDFPQFNAGCGSVLNANGVAEMDASLMDGSSEIGGGISGLKTIRNPINAARAVIRHSRHTLLAGDDAEIFAREMGLPVEDPAYFRTDLRYQQYLQAKNSNTVSLEHGGGVVNEKEGACTIGAVALDTQGNLAAGTSTGGLTLKQPGRVSDSAIIGAGTFASNETCAISGTGTGDVFILSSFANSIHLMMKHCDLPIHEATNIALAKVMDLGGEGGCIAIDKDGNIACPFNTAGMFRAFYSHASGNSEIGVYNVPSVENFL